MPLADEAWRQKIYFDNTLKGEPGAVSYDLGSGVTPQNPFLCDEYFGIDLHSGSKVITADLSSGRLPLSDESATVFTAYDFLEHVPRVLSKSGPMDGIRFPFVDLMSEIFRCLRPGGLFFSSTPCYPAYSAFVDPTHVNIMTEHTMINYFCGKNPQARCYGFKGGFEMKTAAWIHPHFNILLVKPHSN